VTRTAGYESDLELIRVYRCSIRSHACGFSARHAKSCLEPLAIGCFAPTPASETFTQVQHYIESQVFVSFLKKDTPASQFWRQLARPHHLPPSSTNRPHTISMSSTNAQRMQHVSASDARSFAEAVLIGNGVAKENAPIVARCLVEADLRGVDTHGM
jgi:hypothetical protein